MSRQALGRGLRALIPEASEPSGERVQLVPVGAVRPGRHQPRTHFPEEQLHELAASIREHGILEPLIVRRVGELYELVVGERRWRAAQLAGQENVPVVVRNLTDGEAAELALVENLQREDLNPLEEAAAYQRLMTDFGLTQELVAQRVGKPRPTIANRLRLLELDDRIQRLVADGLLSAGHAKVLLSVEDQDERLRLAEEIVATGASVRQVEALVRGKERERTSRSSPKAAKPKQSPAWRHVEERLREKLGTKVRVLPGKPGGRIQIEFYDVDDAQRILDIILGEG